MVRKHVSLFRFSWLTDAWSIHSPALVGLVMTLLAVLLIIGAGWR